MFRFLHRSFPAGAILALGLAAFAGGAFADPPGDIQVLLDRGELREAVEKATALTVANPADCRAWQLLGDAERRLTRVDRAVAAYREGLKACPDDKGLLRGLGLLHDEIEQYEEAVNVLDQLWKLDSTDPVIGSRLGAAAYRAGRCQEGRAAYDALLKAHPDRVADRLAYAQLLARSCRDFTASEAEYRTVLAARANDPSVHCALSYMLAASGRVEEAVKTVEQGLAAVGSDEQGCLYAAWGRALEAGGDSLMIQGNVEEARNYYRQAVAPLQKGTSDPVFGGYCSAILAEVKYKESPMEQLAP
jgi:Flp pilus assembly protein TadD